MRNAYMIKLKSILKEMVSEIGDRITTDNIINTDINRNESSIDVKVGNNTIRVDFYLRDLDYIVHMATALGFVGEYRDMKKSLGTWDDDELVFIEVSFYSPGKARNFNMTNRGNALEVMSAIGGAITEFFKRYNHYDIIGLIYDAKAEFMGDDRRGRLYDKFIEKNLNKISGGEITKIRRGSVGVFFSTKPLNS